MSNEPGGMAAMTPDISMTALTAGSRKPDSKAASSVVAAALAFGVGHLFFGHALSLLPRLALEMFLFGVVYLVVLLLVSDRTAYMEMIRSPQSE